MAQHELTLNVLRDTYVDADYPDTNYSSSTLLKLGGNNVRYILLEFDYSLIPHRKRIRSAILKLYQNQQGPDRLIGAWYADKSFDINTVTDRIFFNSRLTRPAGEEVSAKDAGLKYLPCTNVVQYNISNNRNAIVLQYAEGGLYGPEITFNSKEATSNQPQLVVIYEDVPPDTPTPISPIGEFKDPKSVIRFSWQYNSPVGGEQSKFDLEWSSDQENWSTVSQTTSNTYYDMPANTFPSGNIYWRVRTYNEYAEVSDWSNIQTFYVVGAPSTIPTISSVSAGTARPTVSWAAFNQQIYQVQILKDDEIVYDSGEIPGINIRQHKVIAWLNDGEYTAQVRIKNEYNLWSEWGSTTFTVNTTEPGKPNLSLQRSAYGIELNIQGTCAYTLIYRAEYGSDEYICIAKVDGNYFHDCSVRSGSEYRYFVRSVSENETFSDSDVRLISAEIRYSLIAPISDLAYVFEFRRSLNSPPKRSYSRTLGGSSVEFEGRKYPVWIPNEHVSAGLALTFFLHSWSAVEKFIRLYDRKETVLYRDARGRKIFGVLSGLSVEEEREGYTISFLISQVDYSEEVEV